MPRRLLAPLFALLLCAPAVADEAKRIDEDRTKQIAKALIDATAKLELPVKVSQDEKRGTGLHAGGAVVFVLPDAKLTADVLKKIDKEIVPLGVLYTRQVTPLAAGQEVAAEQHRTVKVTVGDKEAAVSVFTLAAARVAERLVLLVYGKDKKPAVVCELAESEDKTDLPIDLEARQVGKNRAALVVNVLGRYKAAIQVAGQANE